MIFLINQTKKQLNSDLKAMYYQHLASDLNARTNAREDFVDDNKDKHSPINDINSYKFDYPMKKTIKTAKNVTRMEKDLLNSANQTI